MSSLHPDGRVRARTSHVSSWVGIASIGGIDRITEIHIASLLGTRGITPVIEGSVLYGVIVPAADAKRATAILRADARKRRYWIIIGKEHIIAPPEEQWAKRV